MLEGEGQKCDRDAPKTQRRRFSLCHEKKMIKNTKKTIFILKYCEPLYIKNLIIFCEVINEKFNNFGHCPCRQ